MLNPFAACKKELWMTLRPARFIMYFGLVYATAIQGQQYSGPVIDAHAHIRFSDSDGLTKTQPVGAEAIVHLDEIAGISKSALIVIANKGKLDETRRKNDLVIAAAAASHGKLYPVASVHPLDGQAAIEELDRLAKLGVKEIKFHPNSQNFDVADPAVSQIIGKCGELGMAVLFDSYKPWDPAEMGKFLLLSVQHPNTKIVLAHMGFSGFRETLSFAQLGKLGMTRNVWFDLSAIAVAYEGSPVMPELMWTIRKVGTDRFLFGSDWPVDDPAVALKAVRSMGFSSEEERQILHDNVVSLLELK